MQKHFDVRKRFQPAAEARLRLSDPLRNRADATPVERVQVQHAIRLSQAKRAEDDRFSAIGTSPGHGSFSLERPLAGTSKRVQSLKESMARIQMYTTRWCGYCVRAKALLRSKGVEFEEISLDGDPAFRQKLHELTGGWTVPQIVIDSRPVGGYTELWRLDREGRLDERLVA